MTTSNEDEALEQVEEERRLAELQEEDVKILEQKQEILKILKSSYGENSKEDLIKIFKAGKISSDMRRDLRLSKEFAGKGYEDFDLSKEIMYLDIVDTFSDDFVEFNNSKESLKQTILREYNIESKDYDNRIFKKVNVLSNKEIQKLLNGNQKTEKQKLKAPEEEKENTGGELERERFMEVVYGNKIPSKRNTLNFLEEFNIEERRKNLNKSDKRALDIIIGSFQNSLTFDYNAISTLFELNVFDIEEKLEIIHTFSPTISLDKLIDNGIVSKNTGQQIKQNIIQEDFKKKGVLLYDNEVKAIASKIRNDNINVSTDKYVKSEKDIKQFVKSGGLKNVSEAYNDLLKKMKEHNGDIDEFRDKLRKLSTISSPDNFKSGQTIVIRGNTTDILENPDIDGTGSITKSKVKKEIIFFAKIIDDGTGSGIVKIEEKGVNVYNSSLSGESDFSYNAFLGMVSGKAKIGGHSLDIASVDFLSDYQMKEKIRTGEFKSELDVIEFKNKEEELAQAELENSLIYKQEEEKIRNSDEYRRLEKEEGFEVADKLLKKKLEHNGDLREARENLKGIEDFNLKLLVDKLTELDSEGSEFGLEEGTTFEADGQKGKEKGIYTVAFVDKEKKSIILDSPSGPETIDFQSFYETFKEKSARRISKIKNSYDLLSTIQNSSDTKISGGWSSFDEKDGSFHKKEEKYEYDFLVGTGGKSDNKLIKIHSISGNSVRISFGEVTDKTKKVVKKDKDGKVKKDWEGNVIKEKSPKKETEFGVDNESHEVTLGFLHNYILKHGLIPKSLEAEKNTRETDGSEGIDKMHGSLASKFFKGFSVNDLIAGFKLGTDSIEQYLKEGNDEHAAKFANGVFGKFLPAELKTDLLSRVESAQKKRMDEYSQKLKDLDSPAAVALVEKWLLNRDAPGYKKEAGMMFMMEKYGNLYVKDGLYEYKNKFLWYEALGGKIGDELYLDIKKQQEDDNVPFTEEQLIYVLLVKQCKSEGYNGIKRRGRLHKEFKKLRSVGKEAEYQTGLTDGADERTIKGRIDGGMNELRSGSYSNAMGFLERAIEKGGSMQDMNKIPFLMMFSGAAYGFERSMTDKIKNFCGKSMLIPLTRFMSFKSDISLANDTILEVSKRMAELKGGSYAGMGKEAQTIFNNISNSSMPEEIKIEKAEKFYEKYGEEITNALYMLNDGDTGENSDINKLIFLEKDDFIDKDGKKQLGNKKFKKYYDQFSGLMDADTTFDQNEALATDSFKEKGVSGMDMKKSSLELLTQGTVGNFRHKGGAFLWKEIYTELESITQRDYRSHGGRKAQEKVLKDQLRKLSSGLMEIHGSRVEVLDSYNKTGGTFATRFNKWGLYLSKFRDAGVSYDMLLEGESPEGEKMLDDVVKNMLDRSDMTNTVEDISGNGLGSVVSGVQDEVREVSEDYR